MLDIAKELNEEFPRIALEIIKSQSQTYSKLLNNECCDKSIEEKLDCTCLNDPYRNKYGIMTHTKKSVSSFENYNVVYFISAISPQKKINLKEEIEEISKLELVKLALVYHDIGKYEIQSFRGSFPNHAEKSADIVKPHLIQKLSEKQCDYVLKLIRNHHLLDKLIDIVAGKLTKTYIDRDDFWKELEKAEEQTSGIEQELAVLIIANVLAKEERDVFLEEKQEIFEKAMQEEYNKKTQPSPDIIRPFNVRKIYDKTLEFLEIYLNYMDFLKK